MPKYKVNMCRISYAFHTIEIEANNVKEAREKAMDESGEYDYSEKTVEYEPQEIYRVDE